MCVVISERPPIEAKIRAAIREGEPVGPLRYLLRRHSATLISKSPSPEGFLGNAGDSQTVSRYRQNKPSGTNGIPLRPRRLADSTQVDDLPAGLPLAKRQAVAVARIGSDLRLRWRRDWAAPALRRPKRDTGEIHIALSAPALINPLSVVALGEERFVTVVEQRVLPMKTQHLQPSLLATSCTYAIGNAGCASE